MAELKAVMEIPVDPARATVYEHGWQSWSPTAAYRLDERPHRPRNDNNRTLAYRPDRLPPHGAFWGEGLLAVDPGDGEPISVVAAPFDADPIPSIRADVHTNRVVVSAQAPVREIADRGPDGLAGALGRWADRFAKEAGAGPLRSAPTIWCSWYEYAAEVTDADIRENLAAMDDLDVDVDVVQIDDGYQAEIGDWLVPSDRFTSLRDTVARIRDHGRRAGIWTAPFLASPRSELAREHPEWLLPDVSAGTNWDVELRVLDVTHPDVASYLIRVFSEFCDMGVDFFKIDFIYAGALDGRRHSRGVSGLAAYRQGLQLIRGAIGPDSFLLGCGAPILPSVALVDAMRVSPDIDPRYLPADGDLCAPSQQAAALTGRWRAWQHGRFWVNDPDCLIARLAVERRADWAAHVERFGGLRGSSDRLRELDDWGLATTRRLLTRVPAVPFPPAW